MANALFSEFEPIDEKQWKQQIQFELKGLDYNDTLVFESLEGIKIKPFYNSSDLQNDIKFGIPKTYQILQEVYVTEIEKANKAVVSKLEKGAASIWFILLNVVDLEELFKNLPKDKKYFISLNFNDETFLSALIKFCNEHQINLCFDPIYHLLSDGNWINNQMQDFKKLKDIVSNQGTLFIDGSLYQNAGANGVQQLAYITSHLTEYLNEVSPKQIIVKYSIGNHYFFEIAKLRALRILFENLVDFFGLTCEVDIIAQPSLRNKTLYDYNVNMLRTTTEYMSAILGNANYLMPLAYDAVYHKSNPFGDRIARNQLLILKHESYFDSVNNVADGSYFIENLTHTFSQKALELVKMIEKNGGLIAGLKKETIQQHIIESAIKEQQWFDDGKIILVGTNKYPNLQDQMKNDLELYPFSKIKSRQTLIKPLIAKRLSEKLEKERLENEK